MSELAFVILLITLLLITVTLHEFCHGAVAYLLGDSTARRLGRLTLNPLRHIDPLWTVLLPVTLFLMGLPAIGMARPVPVNFAALRHPRRDMIWVALAGPAANILFAYVMFFLYRWSGWGFLLMAVYLNLGLAVFNMLPIPPLDGSRVLMGLLPKGWAAGYARAERFGFLLVLILVWLQVFWRLVIPGINFFCRWWGIPPLGA